MKRSNPKLVVIVGPTASGKSDFAVKLARKYNGEVISADSRQVYRGMDLGSGKITKKEMRGVKHHLLDVASPKSVFTVDHYRRLGRKALMDILKRGKAAIIAGGTGLYIDALLYDTTIPEAKPDPKLRAKLEKKTAKELFTMLKKLDPDRARTIERHNPRRLVRALEIVITTGKPVPAQAGKTYANILQNAGVKPEYILKIGIAPSKGVLQKKIHARLLKRLKAGMVPEVNRLHKQGVAWRRFENLGLDYRYASRYARGLISKKEMMEAIEKESWRYARRQMTWWRRDKEVKWQSKPDLKKIS